MVPTGIPACRQAGNLHQSLVKQDFKKEVVPAGIPACRQAGNLHQSLVKQDFKKEVVPAGIEPASNV